MVLISIAVAGCEEDTQLARVQPMISVDQTEIEFGQVGVGSTRRVGLTVSNEGTADLVVSNLAIQFNNVNASQLNPFFISPPEPFTLPSGGQMSLDMGFAPAVNELASGTLTITSDDPETPQIMVELRGVGSIGQLSLQPDVLDLTETTVGRAQARELVVRNQSIDPLDNARIVTEGFGRPEHFELTGLTRFDEPAPFALDARVRQVLLLTYTPQLLGNDDGLIRIETCGPRCGPEVRVLASATQAVVRLTPSLVEFGRVGIGQPQSESLQVENVGTMAVTITEVEAAGSTAFSVSVPSGNLPRTLQPGESLGVTVTFQPEEAALAQGAVVVRTNLASVPELQAVLTGSGEGPLFVVQPSPLGFGTERGPGSYRRFVVATNAGSSQVQVSSIGLTGNSVLRLGPLPGLPVRLGPGESLNVEVVFEPEDIGQYDGMLTIVSDDPMRPMVDVPVGASMDDRFCDLRFTPNRILFGVLPVLQPVPYERVRTVEVVNDGNRPCTISSGAFRAPADPEIDFLNGPSFPFELQPVSSSVGLTRAEFEFSYAPIQEREAKASFVLATSDQVFPQRTISLAGRSSPYRSVFVLPERLDFGAMTPVICPPFAGSVTLFNSGSTSVRHRQSRLTTRNASTPSPEFTVSGIPGLGQGIFRGDSVTYDLAYQAVDLGDDEAELEVVLEGFPQPIVVPLTGTGSTSPERTEEFFQVDNKEVDVLFVIDDSCSMRENQREVATNFDRFIRAADARQVDFRLGITTTDTTKIPGRLVGPVISRATPNFQEEFRNQAAVGTSGSGFETGLEAMQGALDEAVRGNEPNVDLIRPDAALVVIIVSDEDDQSPLTVTEYATDLVRRTPNGVLPAVVSGQAMGCSNSAGIADPAPDYEAFLGFFGNGVSESICDDWGQTLATLGGQAFGLRRSFRLAIPPDPMSPVDARVNNVMVAPGSFQVIGRDIVFNTPPPEGARIVVTYSPNCQ